MCTYRMPQRTGNPYVDVLRTSQRCDIRETKVVRQRGITCRVDVEVVHFVRYTTSEGPAPTCIRNLVDIGVVYKLDV